MTSLLSGSNTGLFFIAGPCVVESQALLREVASFLVPFCRDRNIPYIFKASYRKANRTSAGSFEGIGDDRALGYLAEIRAEFQVPVLTDIHSVAEAHKAADFGVDILQIPAFLSRQTDIITAAAETGKIVNIKKGQFLAPEDMVKAVAKVRAVPQQQTTPVLLTERGTSFGYHDLVVDLRSLLIMRQQTSSSYCRIVYDATHSVQQPSIGTQSGGKREFLQPLARAAVATGIDGVFFETHPNPASAESDSATQLPLAAAQRFIEELITIDTLVRGFQS